MFPRETHFFQYTNFWVDYRLRRNYPEKTFFAKDKVLQYIEEQNRNDDPFSDNNDFKGYDVERFLSFFDMTDTSDTKNLMEKYWQALCFSLTNNKNNFEKNFVEKSVENVEFACVLRHFFPECKFIHIVRNPYATITAIRKMKGKNGFPFLGPIIQSMSNSYYNLYKNSCYLENYMVVKYEDLLINAEFIMRKICDFLNIKFKDQLLVPTYFGELWGGNSTSGEKFDGISKKPLISWQSIITPTEIKIVNDLYSHVLDRFGYDRLEDKGNWLMRNRHERSKTYLKNRFFYYLYR